MQNKKTTMGERESESKLRACPPCLSSPKEEEGGEEGGATKNDNDEGEVAVAAATTAAAAVDTTGFASPASAASKPQPYTPPLTTASGVMSSTRLYGEDFVVSAKRRTSSDSIISIEADSFLRDDDDEAPITPATPPPPPSAELSLRSLSPPPPPRPADSIPRDATLAREVVPVSNINSRYCTKQPQHSNVRPPRVPVPHIQLRYSGSSENHSHNNGSQLHQPVLSSSSSPSLTRNTVAAGSHLFPTVLMPQHQHQHQHQHQRASSIGESSILSALTESSDEHHHHRHRRTTSRSSRDDMSHPITGKGDAGGAVVVSPLGRGDAGFGTTSLGEEAPDIPLSLQQPILGDNDADDDGGRVISSGTSPPSRPISGKESNVAEQADSPTRSEESTLEKQQGAPPTPTKTRDEINQSGSSPSPEMEGKTLFEKEAERLILETIKDLRGREATSQVCSDLPKREKVVTVNVEQFHEHDVSSMADGLQRNRKRLVGVLESLMTSETMPPPHPSGEDMLLQATSSYERLVICLMCLNESVNGKSIHLRSCILLPVALVSVILLSGTVGGQPVDDLYQMGVRCILICGLALGMERLSRNLSFLRLFDPGVGLVLSQSVGWPR